MEYVISIISALSDPIRLRSLALIAEEKELCVCELTQALQVSQPTISKHMATLRDAGLVKDRRDAQWVLYSLSRDLPEWAETALNAAVKGIRATPNFSTDLERLSAMARPPRLRSA